MSKIIVLKCVGHNPKDFELEESVAVQLGTIKVLLHGDFDAEKKIELNVPEKFNSYIIGKVITFCRNRARWSSDKAYWERFFFHPHIEPNQTMRKELIAIMEASEYLGMESLVELTTQSVANYLEGKTPLTIRSLWKVEGDLTPEEEAKALAMGVTLPLQLIHDLLDQRQASVQEGGEPKDQP